MQSLTLALDWTPNINHIGFFVAQAKGFYQAQDLELLILDPSSDNYAITPAKKVELGQADLALCPTESLISYHTKRSPFALMGIASIFQEDLSAIVVRADAGIESPKALDGKSYASYQARYEDAIVKQMIRHDGGEGNLDVAYPAKLGIWNTLVNGEFDATWIFVNWEGVEAKGQGIDLKLFRMKDYGIPYSYSPVIAAGKSRITTQIELYRKFLSATKQGYLYCQANPQEAAEIIQPHVPASDAKIDLIKALEASIPALGNAETWGRMESSQIEAFLSWLRIHQLESSSLQVSNFIELNLMDQA